MDIYNTVRRSSVTRLVSTIRTSLPIV